MPIIPASTQSFAGRPIPAQNPDSFPVLALSALASGLGGFQQAKENQLDREAKMLMALGPTLISKGQLSMSPGPGRTQVNPGMRLPIYSSPSPAATVADLIKSPLSQVPLDYLDEYEKAQKVLADRPLGDDEIADALQALLEANKTSYGAAGGEVNTRFGKIKVGDQDPRMAFTQQTFTGYDTSTAANPFRKKGATGQSDVSATIKAIITKAGSKDKALAVLKRKASTITDPAQRREAEAYIQQVANFQE